MNPLILSGLLCMAALPIHAAIIAGYQFDETSGTIASDGVRGATGNGTLNTFAGTQWVSGKIGNAISFDGTSDYINALDPLTVGSQHLSISAWVNTNTPTTWATIVACWGNGGYLFGLDGTAGNIGKLANYLNTSVSGVVRSPGTLGISAWHHVAFTYDGTTGATGTQRLYIDGTEVASVTTGVPTSLTSDGTTMGIGAKLNSGTTTTPGTPPGYWNGLIDDLAIFNETLSLGQIQSIKANGDLGISAVPEPSVALLGGFGLLGLLRRRRSVA